VPFSSDNNGHWGAEVPSRLQSHTGAVTKRLSGASLAAFVFCVTACSGGGGSKALTVSDVVRATSTAHTARISYDETDALGSISGAGEADFTDSRYRGKDTGSGLKAFGATVNVILVKSNLFVNTPPAVTWCRIGDASLTREPFGFDPTAVLHSLPPETLQRIGPETIRGVATTHYRILHARGWSELWVDASDFLRRVRSHQGNPESSKTLDLFDYGTPLTPITAPNTAPSCFTNPLRYTTPSSVDGPSAATHAGANVPAVTTVNPKVTATPDKELVDGERITVDVTGFGVGAKVWLSECATARDVTDRGCGPQLPAQTLLVTGDDRAGSASFVVHDPAPVRGYDSTDLRPCSPTCVVVATLGFVSGYSPAYTPITFQHQ